MTLKNARDTLARAQNEQLALSQQVSQAEQSVAAAQKEIDGTKTYNDASLYSGIVDQDKRLVDAESALQKAKTLLEEQTLKAPVDGTVHALIPSTIGGVVTPAQPLVSVVPDGSQLLLDAKLLNKDVGFVHIGDKVTIKLDTFSFQRYGTITGKVVEKSADAIADEKLGPVYMLQVSVDADDAKRRGFALHPGMAATAEIRTGNKRIIDFFLDPITARVDEALKIR